MMTEPKGVKALSEEEIKRQTAFAMVTKSFLITHPLSVRLFVILLSLQKSRFAEYEQDKEYKAGDRLYYVNRDKAVALAVIGKTVLRTVQGLQSLILIPRELTSNRILFLRQTILHSLRLITTAVLKISVDNNSAFTSRFGCKA